jgi:hypothetical protein
MNPHHAPIWNSYEMPAIYLLGIAFIKVQFIDIFESVAPSRQSCGRMGSTCYWLCNC